jgi:hypothetical protein
MQIDSVRELKAKLSDRMLAPLTPAVVASAAVGTRLRPALHVAAQSLSAVEPVQRTIALGITKKGKSEFKLAVRVQRRALQTEEYLASVRKEARGEVDVRYVGRISKRAVPWYRKRNRPIRPGCSIGHFKITAGTLGCFVEDKAGVLHILSNNHVLANENRAKRGDSIIQPGAIDGGIDPAERIGVLARFIRLKPSATNFIDGALATVQTGVKHVVTIKGLGKVSGVFPDPIRDGLAVAKLGRTTGLTRGRITAFELDNVVVSYDLGNLRFDDQIEIEGAGHSPFSDGGDSGSLIVTSGLEGIGLLFAGGDQGGSNGLGLTYANPLDTVLKTLRVSLA